MSSLSFGELPVFRTEDEEEKDDDAVVSGLVSPGGSERGDSQASKSSGSRSENQKVTDVLQGIHLLLEGQRRLEEVLTRQMGAQPALGMDRDVKNRELSVVRTLTQSKPELSMQARPSSAPRGSYSAALTAQNFEIRPELQWQAEQLQDMWSSHQSEDSDEGDATASTSFRVEIFRSGSSGSLHVRDRPRLRCFVLPPMSPFRIAMDLLSVAVLMYDLVSLPLQLAFEIPQEGTLFHLAAGSASFWVIDMLLRFRTAYFHEGHLEVRPMHIAKNYFRTSFLLDFGLVVLDVIALCLNVWATSQTTKEADAFKIWRIGKISRMVRCIGFLRIRVMLDVMDRLSFRSKFLQATSVVLYDVARIIFAIVWLNHVIACGWVGLARSTSSTTGVTWLDTPIGGGAPAEITYAVSGHVYQYLTAFHWALTQMTPGSMQVFPVNSAERIFNNISLIFGVLVFSTLISSITSTVTQFKLGMQSINIKIDKMNQFLRKEGVSTLLSMQVRKQAKEKLTFRKPLVLKDIDAFEWLPLTTQAILRKELCYPHITSHSFFKFMLAADELTAEEFCRTCADFSVLGREDTLFLFGTQAVGMYFIASGSLLYSLHNKSRRLHEILSSGRQSRHVHRGGWLSEAALWCNWRHVGSAEVLPKVSCEILSVRVDELLKVLRGRQGIFGQLASAYARSFCAFLTASLNGDRADWPTDVDLPFLVDEVIGHLPRLIKGYLGRIALRVLKKVIRGRSWMTSLSEGLHTLPDMEKIKAEVQNGEGATLIATNCSRWGVSRFSSFAALKLRRHDGKLMVAFRQQQDQGGHAEAKLPGLKIEEEELPEQAYQRVLSTYFGNMASCVSLESMERDAPLVDNTDEFGVMGVQLRYVFNGVWEPSESPKGHEDKEPDSLDSMLCLSAERQISGSSEICAESMGLGSDFKASDMFLLPSNVLVGWFTQEELNRCQTDAGNRTLGRRLSGLSLQPLPKRYSK